MILTRQAFLLGGWSLSALWLGACEGSVSAPLVAADAAQDTAGAAAAAGEPGLQDADVSSEQRRAEAGRAGASELTYTGDDAAAESGAGVASGHTGSENTQIAGSGGQPASATSGLAGGQGDAVYMRDGGFRTVDVTFDSNAAAELGPDTAGGAVFVMGSLPGAYFSGCSITGNRASNGGGIGALFASQFIYNSVLEHNSAVGSSANNVDPSQCSGPNEAGVFQVGSGGNGGAVYNDGLDVTICGSRISDNRAGAFGAGVFFTSNDASNKGTLVIQDSVMYQNEPPNAVWEWVFGVSTNANTPAPINSDIRR